MTTYTLRGQLFETQQEGDGRWVIDIVLNPQASPGDWKRLRVLGEFDDERQAINRAKRELFSLQRGEEAQRD